MKDQTTKEKAVCLKKTNKTHIHVNEAFKFLNNMILWTHWHDRDCGGFFLTHPIVPVKKHLTQDLSGVRQTVSTHITDQLSNFTYDRLPI